MHCEVTPLWYFGSERKPFFTPAPLWGFQDRFWVLAEGHSETSGPSPEGMVFCSGQEKECCSFYEKPASFLEERTMKITLFSFWWLKFICSFSTPLLRQFSKSQLEDALCHLLLSSYEHKEVAATENVSVSRGTTGKIK